VKSTPKEYKLDFNEAGKYQRDIYKDKNLVVNISIAQNLHFFFEAFISVYDGSLTQQEKS